MSGHLDELLIEFECPVCTDYMYPPIRQCEQGHSICNKCLERLHICPVCQSKFTDIRNRTMEALARKLHFPCVNKNSGCLLKLNLDEKEKHEKVCNFGAYSCAMANCSWKGKYQDIIQHWESKNKSKLYSDIGETRREIKQDTYFINLLKAHGKLFWFRCKTTKTDIMWSIQYIGKTVEAENYYYEIEIFKPNETKRKIILSDYCLSTDLSNLTHGNYSSLPLDLLSKYKLEDGKLVYFHRVKIVPKKSEASSDSQKNPTDSKKQSHERKPHPQKRVQNRDKNSKEDDKRKGPKENLLDLF